MSFYPAYFAVRFRVPSPLGDYPSAFVIVTAYATTGEQWTVERSEAADAVLAARIRELGAWHRRITGVEPSTGHAEPGWAVEMSVRDGMKLGREFLQDAIFAVSDDELTVVSCADGSTATVGRFKERLL